MLFVIVAVPFVVSVNDEVDVPPVGQTRSAAALNWPAAPFVAPSSAFFASFFSTLLMTSVTGC